MIVKKLICIAVAVGISVMSYVNCSAAKNSILLFVDNERVNYINAEPEFINGSVYAPVDETLMLMGFTSRYIENKTWLTISDDKYSFCVHLTDGSFYEGSYVISDTQPIDTVKIVKKNGEYYFPVRSFYDVVGFSVVWDDNNKDVYLYKEDVIPVGSTNDMNMLILDDFVIEDCRDYVWKYNMAVWYYVPKIQKAINDKASNYSIYAQLNEYQAELRRIPAPRGICSALSVETTKYIEAVKYALTKDRNKIKEMSECKKVVEASAKIVSDKYGLIRDINIVAE